MDAVARAAVILFSVPLILGQSLTQKEAPGTSIVGYVRDGCVHRFPQVVKPLPNGCLAA